MIEHVRVARSSQADAPRLRQPGAQRTPANAVAQRVASWPGRHLSPPLGALRPSAGSSEAPLGAGVAALQRAVAVRRTLARDGQDPGPPQMPDMRSLSCGIKDGKFTCTVDTGKGDPVDIDTSMFTPEEKKAAIDPKRPKNCPPDRWNWVWESCCATGKRFDAQQRGCVPVPKTKTEDPPPPLPPPVPEEKGDFPLPAADPAYA